MVERRLDCENCRHRCVLSDYQFSAVESVGVLPLLCSYNDSL